MSGWFKLHRELLEKPIWESSTPEQKTILITLLAMANHKEKEWEFNGEKYKATAGQFVTSLDSIVKKSGQGVSIRNVRTALLKFEKYGFLTSQSTNKNRLITIVNWEFYQSQDEELTSKPTSNRQATDKQPTTNKNVRKKEGKNIKDSSRKRVYDDESLEMKIATFFYQRILKNNPNHKQPNLQNWANDIRLTLEVDNRHKDEIGNLIRWVQNDSFEMANVLSPAKLRKRYDALLIKMKQQPAAGKVVHMPTKPPEEFKMDYSKGE